MGSSSFLASSGSRSARSSIEPLRSAKSTVTCLRSPSRAALEVRILSARCLGVYDSGEANRDWPGDSSATGVPHLLQNRDPDGSSLPHELHELPKRPPQPRQKFDPVGFSCWHRGHFMERPYRRLLSIKPEGRRVAGGGARCRNKPRYARSFDS